MPFKYDELPRTTWSQQRTCIMCYPIHYKRDLYAFFGCKRDLYTLTPWKKIMIPLSKKKKKIMIKMESFYWFGWCGPKQETTYLYICLFFELYSVVSALRLLCAVWFVICQTTISYRIMRNLLKHIFCPTIIHTLIWAKVSQVSLAQHSYRSNADFLFHISCMVVMGGLL